MFRSCAVMSPKFKMNTHPKNAVAWKPDTPGFYKPFKGASKFKWHFTIPYVREQPDSLYHYPDISKVSGKVIDWYHGETTDGYYGVHTFGENTLELKGMPMGRTPEYMQERLRRFFSKFGPVRHCRADPHPLDPYQCEGTAYVTFRDRAASLKALKAPLKFPAALHDKVVHMRHLDTDKRNDPDYYEKSKFWNNELISVARQLHIQLSTHPDLKDKGVPLAYVGHGLMERELVPVDPLAPPVIIPGRGGIPPRQGGLSHGPTRNIPAKVAAKQRFGSWEAFIAEPPFDELFSIQIMDASEASASSPSSSSQPAAQASEEAAGAVVVVRARLVNATQRARILVKARMMLGKRLHDEFSVWWREGKVPLPEYTQRRIEWWDYKPKLPEELQILSRSKDRHKIHDEKYLYRRTLIKARNERRQEVRAEWLVEKKQRQVEKDHMHNERRQKAMKAVEDAGAQNMLGLSNKGLVPGEGGTLGWRLANPNPYARQN